MPLLSLSLLLSPESILHRRPLIKTFMQDNNDCALDKDNIYYFDEYTCEPVMIRNENIRARAGVANISEKNIREARLIIVSGPKSELCIFVAPPWGL